MMTEIECMLSVLRQARSPFVPVLSVFAPGLSEGPRVGGARSTYAEECRAAFKCDYCGGHNLLQCSPYHCAVKRIEPSSPARRGRSGGA